ncbi:MAG: hydroxyisourate hydrolase [Albidovulum sp.]|nr:hydroxyisourate hydrolase [Albidovulum sp.]MDE0305076.1 hydroxyisourate hydrolase [Albidovulum sp.]MDE0533538.1 hydroxyisourate hydrolase [Albidovulum sp.]
MGRLTTHVLDTSMGRPAKGLRVELRRIGESDRVIASGTTNSDGRLDGPLLEKKEFKTGTYELAFFAGDYFRSTGLAAPKPLFLDVVPIRFGVSEDGHYHVPLLLSPYGYSTYRGS